LFEVVLSASGVRFMAVQSNDVLLAVMLHTYGRDIRSEAIVFRRRRLGSYLLQELKRVAYELGTSREGAHRFGRASYAASKHPVVMRVVEHSVRGVASTQACNEPRAETQPPKRDQRPNAWRG
jgi:hypothetical protein